MSTDEIWYAKDSPPGTSVEDFRAWLRQELARISKILGSSGLILPPNFERIVCRDLKECKEVQWGDFYTNSPLKWNLIKEYRGEAMFKAKPWRQMKDLQAYFCKVPTLDPVFTCKGELVAVRVCARMVRQAKIELSYPELYVLAHDLYLEGERLDKEQWGK